MTEVSFNKDKDFGPLSKSESSPKFDFRFYFFNSAAASTPGGKITASIT